MKVQIDWHRLQQWPPKKALQGVCQNALPIFSKKNALPIRFGYM